MKTHRIEIVGGYKNGCLSAPDSCTVEVNSNTIEATKARLNALFGLTIREHDILYEDTDSTIVKVTENRGRG